MKPQRLGIVTSLLIHAGFLVLLLSVPVANAIPFTKTITISFTQEESSPSATQKEMKAIAKPQPEEMQHTSKPVAEITHRQDEVLVNEKPVVPTGQKTEHHPPVKTEIANLGKIGNQATSETIFGNSGAPSFIHREAPVYPFLARRFGKEGKVLLKLLIDKNGCLQDIEIIEPSGFGFTEAAVEAVKKSSFAPAHRNGEKIASKATLSVRFILR
jgi:periplasmic protein TonB